MSFNCPFFIVSFILLIPFLPYFLSYFYPRFNLSVFLFMQT